MGDCAYTWFVNAGHLYLADEDLDIGTPVVQPHGGKVLYNITEWSWKQTKYKQGILYRMSYYYKMILDIKVEYYCEK